MFYEQEVVIYSIHPSPGTESTQPSNTAMNIHQLLIVFEYLANKT